MRNAVTTITSYEAAHAHIFIGCFSGSTVAYNGNAHKSCSYLFILLLYRPCRCTFSSPVFYFICCWRCVDYWQSFSIIMWTLNTHIRPHTHTLMKGTKSKWSNEKYSACSTPQNGMVNARERNHTHTQTQKSDAKNEKRNEWLTKQHGKKKRKWMKGNWRECRT